jgi:branched-subunit amino acid transport protein AzlD
MMPTTKLVAAIAVIAAVTFFTRFFPFLLFGAGGKKPPELVTFLGKYLPPAIICAILVYCFSGVSLSAYPFAVKEVLAVAIVVLLQLWKENAMLSIFTGTAAYMFFTQVLFAV